MFSENIMSHFPEARKLRTESMTKGLSWADQEIQKVMVTSAQLKAEETLKSLESKGMYDVTNYGQAWISDNIMYLSEKLMYKPTTEVVKAFMDFPAKFHTEDGLIVSADDYLKNSASYKAQGIRYTAPKEGVELTPLQLRTNEFVMQAGRAKSRSHTVAFIILTEMLDMAMSEGAELTVTGCAGRVMNNILHQLIVLKGVELKTVVEVPSVSLISDESKWLNSKGQLSLKGSKMLKALKIKSISNVSHEGLLKEGRELMELVCDALKDMEISEGCLSISEELRDKLKDIRLKSVSTACDYRPVLEKPISDGLTTSYRDAPLKDFLVGGYRTELGSTTRISEFDRQAIDRIQGTAFNVNRRVLETIKKAITMGVSIGDKLNVVVPEDLPQLDSFPKAINYKNRMEHNEAKRIWFESESNKQNYIKWKEKDLERKKDQVAAVSINDMNSRTLEIAQWYMEWGGPFYLPVFMDYRTRMYYAPTTFNPQSSKLSKSLFLACRGKAIGTEKSMEYWLVNFAGSMKKVKGPDGTEYAGDKSPWNVAVFAGRQELKTGAKIAGDPLSQESLAIWTVQDNPFEYLAHCFECPGILEEGLEFVSRLFISMDGSCNAYQHAAGYLADKKTGELVNLTYRGPDEAPEDLYGKVSNGFSRSLTEAPIHRKLKFHNFINRDSCKRITMCQGYGLTPSGARKYGKLEVEKYTNKDDQTNPFDSVGLEEAANSFAEGVMSSVTEVAPAITKVKEALQKLGELACQKEWNPSGVVSWTTYTGTTVNFTKKQTRSKEVDIIRGNKRLRFVYKEMLNSVDQVEVSNAMAPNYTHSRDADHLRLSVMSMPEGCSFLVVHDSFGTLAADAPTLCHNIKEKFVEMYKDKNPLDLLFRETLRPCLEWLGRSVNREVGMDWLIAGGIEELVLGCERGGSYSGKEKEQIRKVIRSLKNILDNIKQTKDLDFDAIMTCIYPFR